MVVPARQDSGAGARLVRAGLDACRALGAAAVVVLGHPRYYPRFGFVPAARFGLECEYGGGEAFMAQELIPGALAGDGGLVRYESSRRSEHEPPALGDASAMNAGLPPPRAQPVMCHGSCRHATTATLGGRFAPR